MINYILILMVLLIGCHKSTPENQLTFDQVGYFKSDDNLRYFTFFINSQIELKPDSIPISIINQIKEHGGKQAHTNGKITASFYYTNKNQAPNISALSAKQASLISHQRKPVFSVWITRNGNVDVISEPYLK